MFNEFSFFLIFADSLPESELLEMNDAEQKSKPKDDQTLMIRFRMIIIKILLISGSKTFPRTTAVPASPREERWRTRRSLS